MMTNLFIKNNLLLLIIKGLITTLLCILFLLENIDLIQYTNSLFNLKNVIKKDRIEMRSICLLSFNHDSIDNDTMNELYQMLKKNDNLLLQYTYYSSNEHTLYMDIETYRGLYDTDFNEELPCVLVPQERLKDLTTVDHMKVVGSNSLIETDSLRLEGYDPNIDYVVLYEDLILDKYGFNFAFSPGHQFILSTENEENLIQIEELLIEVKEKFEHLGYPINFITSRFDNQLEEHAQSYNRQTMMERESLQNISISLILISGILLLSQIIILLGKKIIACCLFIGKRKIEIFIGMLSGVILTDLISVLLSTPLLINELFELNMKTIFLIIFVLLGILALLDGLILGILLLKTDSKSLLQQIQRNEE